MRFTKKVSMWPVGLITKYGVSSPIVRNGTISGFYDGWIGGRKFPVDMAGFAVNVNFLLSRPNASMPYKPGYEEDGFLKSLSPLNLTEIEVMASNCTQVCCSKHSNFSIGNFSIPKEFTQTRNRWTDDKLKFLCFPLFFSFSCIDSRVAYTVEEKSKCYGTRHGKIQQHEPGGFEADSRVTCEAIRVETKFL